MSNCSFCKPPVLPPQMWMPHDGASICVYWDRTGPGTFTIALQLIDRSLIAAGDSGIILRTTLSSAVRVQLPFSLRDGHTGALLLSGRFELRTDAHGSVQLWLLDARYPGGFTAAAQISGAET